MCLAAANLRTWLVTKPRHVFSFNINSFFFLFSHHRHWLVSYRASCSLGSSDSPTRVCEQQSSSRNSRRWMVRRRLPGCTSPRTSSVLRLFFPSLFFPCIRGSNKHEKIPSFSSAHMQADKRKEELPSPRPFTETPFPKKARSGAALPVRAGKLAFHSNRLDLLNLVHHFQYKEIHLNKKEKKKIDQASLHSVKSPPSLCPPSHAAAPPLPPLPPTYHFGTSPLVLLLSSAAVDGCPVAPAETTHRRDPRPRAPSAGLK